MLRSQFEKMVEVFKGYALELAKIRAKFEELCKAPASMVETVKLSDVNLASWEAGIRKLAEVKKSQEGMLEFKEAHLVLMRQYHAASVPLRMAVAKEWEASTETQVAQNLLRGWVATGNSYRLVKRTNLTKGPDPFQVKSKEADEWSLWYQYTGTLDTPGHWRFVPFMEGQSLDVQKAVIRAMTPPDYEVSFADG